jgi:hypothetical protein
MEYKTITKQELSEKATKIINAPYTAIDGCFYESTKWVKTRDEYIKANPFCELCLNKGKNKKSDDVHHITLLTAGGEPFAEDNLIALCDSCHSSIHAEGGIAVEINIDNLFGFDHINNFTTQLKNIDATILSQCKEGDKLILIREHRQDNPSYVGVAHKSGKYVGEIKSADVSHHYLAFDIDHGSEVSSIIKEIFTKRNKLQCVIKITKSEIDWNEYERFNIIDKEASELINNAKLYEKTDFEQAVQLYKRASEILLDMDKQCKQYPAPWRRVKFPINRISLVLERQKKYKECLEEIEAYQKVDDKVGLYSGEKESIEKRKSKVLKLLRKVNPQSY